MFILYTLCKLFELLIHFVAQITFIRWNSFERMVCNPFHAAF